MYCLCFDIYRAELLKSKLPVTSHFLGNKNHVAQESLHACFTQIRKYQSFTKRIIRNSLEVAEVKICSRVSHGKALPLIC